MADFLDFTSEITKKPDLAMEFVSELNYNSPEKLSDWFRNKSVDVTLLECVKLVKNRETIANMGLY